MSFRLMVQFVSPFSDASAINLSMTPLLESKGNYTKKIIIITIKIIYFFSKAI
ncbi:hypothetical protein HanPSC8_Chr15g0666421 [Helianthus annuus]|nr:hypothetical protein HanPSC8_Chr15g0666421 [Helianthus annuus]